MPLGPPCRSSSKARACRRGRRHRSIGPARATLSTDKGNKERRAKAARRSSRSSAQGLRSSGTSPKKAFSPVLQKQRPLAVSNGSADDKGPCRRCLLRSQPRSRLGLGHPLGRDPWRTNPPYQPPTSFPLQRGHFYLAEKRTFLFGVDRAKFWLCRRHVRMSYLCQVEMSS
jgi:hypothetical protein